MWAAWVEVPRARRQCRFEWAILPGMASVRRDPKDDAVEHARSAPRLDPREKSLLKSVLAVEHLDEVVALGWVRDQLCRAPYHHGVGFHSAARTRRS
jgi:hypothetical protein